jgi:cell division protein FtsI (penicillin-binding protein 3)
LLLLGFVMLAVRAGQLTVINTDARDRGAIQIGTHLTLPSARGLILDRNRRELAISVDAPSVYVMPRLIEEPAETAKALSRILGLDRAALTERIGRRGGFTYLARWISDEQAARVEALELAGVGIDHEPRRTYPAGRLAAPLLGFADIDGNGVRGLEQMMDEWLKGKPRRVAVERDARGRLLCSSLLDPRTTAGGDVVLTIDSGLQGQAEAALIEAVATSEARSGLVIAVDPRTGDILTLAEAPGFDPNHFRSTDYLETRSRAFLDAVEPGSTMKAFVVAAALEAGVIGAKTQIDTGEGWMRVRGKTIRDHHAYGVIDPATVLRYSSNVGTVQIAQTLGAEHQYAALARFGFGATTGSGFPSESRGLVRRWESWKPVDHATISFGQGINVTAIQLAMALASLANDGERMQPRLVISRRRATGSWQHTEPVSAGQTVRPEIARSVIGMMESVVSGQGTGRLAALSEVRVAGKTGTAQKLDRETGRYSQTRYTAGFMGVAPADDPQIVIVVALDEPMGKSHTGGGVAAPLFASVAAAQLAHQGIITKPEPIAYEPVQTIDDEPKPEIQRTAENDAVSTPEVTPAQPAPAAAAPQNRPPVVAPVTAWAAEQATLPTVVSSSAAPKRTPMRETRRVAALPAVSTGPRDRRPSTGAPAGFGDAEEMVLVPNFRGESLADAKRMASQDALDRKASGSSTGRVVEQSPPAGTILGGPSRTVVLRFGRAREEG